MTSPPRLSRRTRLRPIIPDVFALLGLLIPAGLGIWETWYSYEAYYLAKHSSGIDAEVISASSHKINLSGLVKFRLYDGDVYRECIAKADFGGESNYINFKPGAIIKIIPRTDCDNPVVVTANRFPIFAIIMGIFYIALAFGLAKNMRQAFR